MFKIDFDSNTVHYFNGLDYQGSITPTKNVLQEGKLFPCVDMSANTEGEKKKKNGIKKK